MKRVAMPITFAIAFFIGTVFNHPNAWFLRAAETVSPSPGGEGRGEGGLQTKIKLPFRIFRQSLKRLFPRRPSQCFRRGSPNRGTAVRRTALPVPAGATG